MKHQNRLSPVTPQKLFVLLLFAGREQTLITPYLDKEELL